MGIFNRNRPGSDASQVAPAENGSLSSQASDGLSQSEIADLVEQDSDLAGATGEASWDRSQGPFDHAEVSAADLEGRLDLGALLVVPLPDSELRLDVDEDGQNLTGVTAVVGEAAIQLQAFAAPKSAGVWQAIRTEIAANLIEAGGTADEVVADFGTQLHVRMPTRGADGRTTYTPVRFLGVDGPRWFLRAVLTGQAAVDDEVADRLLEFARSAVVLRGSEARAPRELLELRVPQELLEQAQADQEDHLNPFERGPEIAEVR